MKKTLSLIAVAGLLTVSATVPAQAQTETVEAPVEVPAVVTVPADAPAPVVTLEAVEAVEAPAEPVAVPVSAPVTAEPVAPAEPVYVAPEDYAVDAPEWLTDVNDVVVDYEAVAEAVVADPVTVVNPEAPEAVEAPEVYSPADREYAQASDGSWMPVEFIEEYEARIVNEPAPVTYDPSENVMASDGSMVHPSHLAEYEADLAAGIPKAVGHDPIPPTPEQEAGLPEVWDAGTVPPGHTVEP